MNKIKHYFPGILPDKLESLRQLQSQILDWNEKINLISRKDTEHITEHHILHSLSIAKYIQFKEKSKILDLGTGGGFPGLPLAILFPDTEFFLVDARAKKITVVNEIVKELKLENCRGIHGRVEEIKGLSFDFIVSRAVAKLEVLLEWSDHLISKKMCHGLPNGLICLKGGDLNDEIAAVKKKYYVEKNNITDYINEKYFEDKYIIYVQK